MSTDLLPNARSTACGHGTTHEEASHGHRPLATPLTSFIHARTTLHRQLHAHAFFRRDISTYGHFLVFGAGVCKWTRGVHEVDAG